MWSDLEKEVERLKKVAKRYLEAYRVARTIDGIGNIIRTNGKVFAVLFALAGFFILSQGRSEAATLAVGILCIVAGIAIGALFYSALHAVLR